MSKKGRIGIVLAIVAMVTLATLGIFFYREKSEQSITIGVSLPLSGDAAVWGKSQKDGYELALSQINARGGINGKKVVLLFGDDKGLPKDGVSLLKKFLDVDGIRLLTGVANSSVRWIRFSWTRDWEKISDPGGSEGGKRSGWLPGNG